MSLGEPGYATQAHVPLSEGCEKFSEGSQTGLVRLPGWSGIAVGRGQEEIGWQPHHWPILGGSWGAQERNRFGLPPQFLDDFQQTRYPVLVWAPHCTQIDCHCTGPVQAIRAKCLFQPTDRQEIQLASEG